MNGQDGDRLAERFDQRRGQLRAVAYRMLGSLSDADEAVQEAWLRLSRSDAEEIEQLDAWLTTVVARICLNMLRTRTRRREDGFGITVPDPVVTGLSSSGPEEEALLADSVGLALLVVVETLSPAERLAFVLHDMFAMPFEEIAPIVDRSPAAARQLASRARRRVRGRASLPDADLPAQQEVVEAFFAAARGGDVERLISVLDPEVVLLSDNGAENPATSIRGAHPTAQSAVLGAHSGGTLRKALVNGGPGAVVFGEGRPVAVMAFTVAGGRIVEIDVLRDQARLARLDLG